MNNTSANARKKATCKYFEFFVHTLDKLDT